MLLSTRRGLLRDCETANSAKVCYQLYWLLDRVFFSPTFKIYFRLSNMGTVQFLGSDSEYLITLHINGYEGRFGVGIPRPCGNLIRALVNILQAAQTSAGVLAPSCQSICCHPPARYSALLTRFVAMLVNTDGHGSSPCLQVCKYSNNSNARPGKQRCSGGPVRSFNLSVCRNCNLEHETDQQPPAACCWCYLSS